METAMETATEMAMAMAMDAVAITAMAVAPSVASRRKLKSWSKRSRVSSARSSVVAVAALLRKTPHPLATVAASVASADFNLGL